MHDTTDALENGSQRVDVVTNHVCCDSRRGREGPDGLLCADTGDGIDVMLFGNMTQQDLPDAAVGAGECDLHRRAGTENGAGTRAESRGVCAPGSGNRGDAWAVVRLC